MDRHQEDPLEDTASHVPLVSLQQNIGGSVRLQAEEGPRQVNALPPEGLGQQGHGGVPPQAPPVAAPAPYTNPIFLAQVVRVVIESMSGTAPVTLVSSDNITVLVRTVKNMRELGCEAFLGEQDAEITGRWLRKVESFMTQMRVPKDWQVSCSTQLLSDRAQTWWEVIQSRRTTGICTWGEFRKQFETQFFSPFQCRIKELEFLALKQGNIIVIDYERRFHDLSLFAPQFVTTEQEIIDRLRDGLRQELRQGLVALRFESSRGLIEAAQALEACMSKGQQGQVGFGKRKDTDLT
jgi:hypothetical protein